MFQTLVLLSTCNGTVSEGFGESYDRHYQNLEIEAGYSICLPEAINVPIDAFIINLDGVDVVEEGGAIVSVTSDDEDDDDAGVHDDFAS
jgi:hypothetical protein